MNKRMKKIVAMTMAMSLFASSPVIYGVAQTKEVVALENEVMVQKEETAHESSVDEVSAYEEKVENELTREEVAKMQVELLNRFEDANSRLIESGRTNLYPKLKTREKTKWLKRINEGNYFESEEMLQYQISGLYEIAEDQYYVLGWAATTDGELKLAEKWEKEEEEGYVPQGIFELILQKDESQYFVTHKIYPSETLLTSEELDLYKKETAEESNIAIEYNKVRQLEEVEDYVTYLDEAISEVNEEAVNDTDKSEVTQYVQYAIENLSEQQTVATDNTITVETDMLTEMKDALGAAKEQFDQLLEKSNISFNKDLNMVLKLETTKANFKKPIYITLPEQMEDLEDVTGLRILLDEASYVYIDGKDLMELAGLKIKIERQKDKATYEISFLNDQDEVIPQLDQTITFAFNAQDEFSTVTANYGEESENWGGQYDAASGTIAFGTKYSGRYTVVDHKVNIVDIDELTSSQQSAIKFMVSKGYLSLDGEHFYPNASFSRYEFAEALVKMFFALDKELTTDFKDVPKDSPYYAYVASGQTYEIIKGYVDQTFKGEVNIPTEQVISLCARTIADRKGYIYPEDASEYVKFADAEEISSWALNDIALAVQSGLITGGGNLVPKAEITKAESAEILYNLFMLLYETSPGEVVEMTAVQKTYSIGFVLIAALIILSMVRRFIRKNKVVLTMLVCTAAIIATLIIGFKGGF